ncbi:MAG: hypothetical protein ACOZNI_03885 [Myxococcota bacterium]
MGFGEVSAPDAASEGEADSQFGYRTVAATVDGSPRFVVAAPSVLTDGPSAVYLWNGVDAPSSMVEAESDAERLGFRLARAGDRDGDGSDEVIVASGFSSLAVFDIGHAAVRFEITGHALPYASEGIATSNPGGESADFLAVADHPSARVFFFDTELESDVSTSEADGVLSTEPHEIGSRIDVQACGDLDGDGRSEMTVSRADLGLRWVVADWARDFATADDAGVKLEWEAPSPGSTPSEGAAAVGGVNRDGLGDLAVAVPSTSDVEIWSGAAFRDGDTDPAKGRIASLSGDGLDVRGFWRLAALGDLDGDGTLELGATDVDWAFPEAHRAWVVYGPFTEGTDDLAERGRAFEGAEDGDGVGAGMDPRTSMATTRWT